MLARQLWTSAGVEYHATRLRIDLARAFLGVDDETGAATEIAAAERAAVRIGSSRLQRMVADLRPKPVSHLGQAPVALPAGTL